MMTMTRRLRRYSLEARATMGPVLAVGLGVVGLGMLKLLGVEGGVAEGLIDAFQCSSGGFDGVGEGLLAGCLFIGGDLGGEACEVIALGDEVGHERGGLGAGIAEELGLRGLVWVAHEGGSVVEGI